MSLFIREPSVDLSGFSAEDRIRRNAYVTVTSGAGEDAVTLPVKSDINFATDAEGKDVGLYRSDSRPQPVLQGVEVTLEGTAGALKRAEGKFICFTTEQFDTYEAALLRPGSDVTIKYGYVNSEASDSGTFTGKVYSFDFKYTEQNYIECTFKAVGQGNALSKSTISYIPAVKKKPLSFVKNYSGTNEKAPVNTIFDYFDWEIQDATGKLDDYQFDPEDGGYVDFKYYVTKAPARFQSEIETLETGMFSDYRLVYIRFDHIIDTLNRFSGLPREEQIYFDTSISYSYKDNFNLNTFPLTPCDPLRVAWKPKSSYWVYFNPATALTSIYNNLSSFFSSGVSDSNILQFKGSEMFGLEFGPRHFYISRDELRKLEKQYLRDEKINNSDDPQKKLNAQINVEEFLQGIFEAIKKSTANIVDLTLMHSIDSNTTGMIITDRNALPDTKIKPLVFDPAAGDGITRQLLLSGKVPKSIAADAFTKATNSADPMADAGTSEIISFGGADRAIAAALEYDLNENKEEYAKALAAMDDAGCGPAGVSAMIEFFRKQLQAKADAGAITGNVAPQYPLELDLTLNGIEGFNFGDLISSKLLPKVYRNDLDESKIGFTVTRVSHKIENNDWTTSLTGTCRLLP